MVLHINHANEVDGSVICAVGRLRAVCRSVLNQAVILRGVNDSAKSLITLSERLFEAGIDPYYLNVLDRVAGAHHFDVNDAEVATLYEALLNALPGYLVPKLVREVPGVGTKCRGGNGTFMISTVLICVAGAWGAGPIASWLAFPLVGYIKVSTLLRQTVWVMLTVGSMCHQKSVSSYCRSRLA